MKKNFETRTETEKALSELPQDVQPFKDTDFAKNALSRRQSAERACSLRRKRRLCAALSLAVLTACGSPAATPTRRRASPGLLPRRTTAFLQTSRGRDCPIWTVA